MYTDGIVQSQQWHQQSSVQDHCKAVQLRLNELEMRIKNMKEDVAELGEKIDNGQVLLMAKEADHPKQFK